MATRDEAAFRALYRRHGGVLWGVGLRSARGDEEEAREIVQETWVRAVEGLEGFRWESSLRTWLVSVALNVGRERARRANRETPLGDPLGNVEMPVEAIDLGRAIDALPDGYREVLVLHDLEGFTHEEIGGLLGVAAGTSKSQLHRARARVRARLAAAEGGAR
ncbi:MAG TPA: RNA polymerase sigma factor [Gemmatimonadota bacterium]|nr:RNA polymerase sigma factor [Gemmatimonadota bacterium]